MSFLRCFVTDRGRLELTCRPAHSPIFIICPQKTPKLFNCYVLIPFPLLHSHSHSLASYRVSCVEPDRRIYKPLHSWTLYTGHSALEAQVCEKWMCVLAGR